MKKILLIEDDAPLSWLLEKILKTRYDVTTIHHGMEAWSWLSEGNIPDLIIYDVNRPSSDGLELLENLRISGLYNEIPFIILSGVPSPEQRDECMELGASSYIVKPFDPQFFLTEVQHGLLQRSEVVFID